MVSVRPACPDANPADNSSRLPPGGAHHRRKRLRWGAGIQADLKTFHAFGVFGTSAITAVTAQNTVGVAAVHTIPADVVRAQIDAVAGDLHPSAVKTGMLATAETGGSGRRGHRRARPDRLRDGSGHARRQWRPTAANRRRGHPGGATPPLGRAGDPQPGRGRVAHRRAGRFAGCDEGGGAAPGRDGGGGGAGEGRPPASGEAADVFWNGAEERVWRRPRIPTRHVHGTGCTLSAAVAAGLARGRTMLQAVDAAVEFVARAIAMAPGLGAGGGPINHFVGTNHD